MFSNLNGVCRYHHPTQSNCWWPFFTRVVYLMVLGMAIPVVEFSRGGYKIRKIFWLKINIPIGNQWILRIGVVASCQKLGIILENKVIERLLLSKNVNYKKSAPKFVFFNEKKMRKSPMIFGIENWVLKVKFFHFLTPRPYANSQNSIISLRSPKPF